MKYNIIGSSSKGNAIIIEDIILLDCGVSYSKLKTYLKKIKLIFISHIHKDHLLPTTIKKIAYNYPNIKYICGSSDVVYALTKNGVAKKNIYILDESKRYNLGICKVKLESLIHDVPNHLIKIEIKDKKCIYIVDTSNVDNIVAKNYDLYLIENNYQKDLFQEHLEKAIMEKDDGMQKYLKRIPYTHLSSEQCNSFLIENMGDNSTYQYIHQSDYNYEEEK